MTFEFKNIIEAYFVAKQQNLKCVLATVVHLEGSSYRKPGVRMLIVSNGKMLGAISGGCVEQEVKRQSESVFITGVSKIMSYDGRYRLGCEGILYVLLEPMQLEQDFLQTFRSVLKNRKTFKIQSVFKKEIGENLAYKSIVSFKDKAYSISGALKFPNEETDFLEFSETLSPCFRLIIFGTEHDAVQLCKLASNIGWEVLVVGTLQENKLLSDFPGANQLLNIENIEIQSLAIDKETAVILMSHNFARDFKYLMHLQFALPLYLGLLGPVKRRETLITKFLEHNPEFSNFNLLDKIYGPAGLNIGAETPQEIAVSIISEILSVIRHQEPKSLRNKAGAIHGK